MGTQCGAGHHLTCALLYGGFTGVVDLTYCKYMIHLGTGMHFLAKGKMAAYARPMADARSRGMKLVVVDPRLAIPAAKADEWLPIRPDTDGALALGMVNLLVNEYGLYDAPFLKRRTNGPYLIGPDGYYVRDKDSKKPLVWDLADSKAKPFDDPNVKDAALEGTYTVDSVQARPGFALLKENLKKYPVEKVAEITTIPAATIRRITREYGEAACIGSTMVIEGVTLPYRPVAVNYYRGACGHTNQTWICLALELLNIVVGNMAAVGGSHNVAPLLGDAPDGLMNYPARAVPLPTRKVKYPPQELNLLDVSPIGTESDQVVPEVLLNLAKYGIEYKPQMMLHNHCNPIMNAGNSDKAIAALKTIPFVATSAVHMGPTEELADIVMPESCYLERYDGATPGRLEALLWSGYGQCFFSEHLRQPVVEPLYDTMNNIDLLIELADRAGFLYGPKGFNAMLNGQLKDPFKLDVDKKHTFETVLDCYLKSTQGAEYGLEWFKKNGFKARPATLKEIYQPYGERRIPIYYEFLKKAGDEMKQAKAAGTPILWDPATYVALPEWFPSPINKAPKEYDLFAIYYHGPLYTHSKSAPNPWLMETIEKVDPYFFNVQINAETAKAKGIADGDLIAVESEFGKVEGKAKLCQGIHPEVIAIGGNCGHWSMSPIAKGKGMAFNDLLPLSVEYSDPLSGGQENAVKIKVRKVGK